MVWGWVSVLGSPTLVRMNETADTHKPGLRAWLGLVVILGPVLLVAMDGSVLFLAMPKVAEALSPTAGQALWTLDVYGFVVGSLLITFGGLGDRYGRLKLLMIGVTLFGLASLGAAFATSPEMLITFRGLMGLAGATLLPSALAVLGELFVEPRQRAQAIGIFAAAFAAGFAIGPAVGGQLLSYFWWGSVFLVNLPVLVLFLVLAPFLLREVQASRTGRRIDVLSVVQSVAGLLMTVYAIKHMAAEGFSATLVIVGLAGAVILALFIRRQLTVEHPLIDFSLFRDRVFTIAIITGLLPLAAWSATAYLSGVYLQSVLGVSVLRAALLSIPGALLLTVTCIVTPMLVTRVGKRSALITCHTFIAAGLLLLLPIASSGGVGWYIASTVLAGVGYGISFSLVAETAVAAVPPERAGSAAAIAETSNEIGNALGIALLGSLSVLIFRLRGPDLAGTFGETLGLPGLAPAVIGQAKDAFVTGLRVVAVVAGLLHLILGLLTLRWVPKVLDDEKGAGPDDGPKEAVTEAVAPGGYGGADVR